MKKRVIRNDYYYELKDDIEKALFGYYMVEKLYNFDNIIIKRIKLFNLEYEKEIIDNIEWIAIDKKLKDTILTIFIEDSIKIANCKTNITIDNLTKEILDTDFYTYEKVKEELEKKQISIPDRKKGIAGFEKQKVSIVHLRKPINKMFFLKKHIDELLEIIDSSVDIREIEGFQEKYFNTNSKRRIKAKFNVTVYTKLPFVKEGIYIKKTEIDYVKRQMIYHEEIENAKTEFERLQAMIKYSNLKTSKVETIKMFLDYCRDKSNNTKSKRKNRYANSHFRIYELLCSETLLKKELSEMSVKEQYDFSQQLFNLVNDTLTLQTEVIYFFNYLKEKYDLKGLCKYQYIKEHEEILPYSEECFLNLLLVIFDILSDRERVLLLIDNMKLSGGLLYIYLHYCIAWRKADIIKQLPKPNLNLLNGFINSDDLNNWIQNKENIFTEEMGELICEDIQAKIKALNLKASKNNKKLQCIIPKHMYQTLGLLFCICELNRRKYKHRNNKSDYLILKHLPNSNNIENEINKIFDIDIRDILYDNFSSLRANKTFLNIINNKSEEFGLACGYYLSQTLRSHKSKKNILSETTKIYLDKDVSRASVEAFLNGTMGCVKYNLLSIIDEDFDLDNSIKKLEKSYCLDITPKEVEQTFKLVHEKSKRVDNFLKKYLTTPSKKQGFLKELLYGENYGKHEGTKCLIKIMKSSQNKIHKIGVTENNDCIYNTSSCIGCNYLVTLKSFIYEFENKFNEMLESLENSKSVLDKRMNIDRFLKLYLPIIIEIQNEFGEDLTKTILDSNRYNLILKRLNGEDI